MGWNPGQTSELTIAQWLDRHHQSSGARESFWDPLAVAIMNETPERASADLFCHSLRQAFLKHPHDAALVFPRVGLSSLFAGPARAFIEQHNTTVQCGADVHHVSVAGGKAVGVVLKDGRAIPCAAAILAVPAPHVARLLPASTVPGLTQIAEAGVSPIIGIHLWMDTGFMDTQALGLIGRRIQWVFKRERHLSLVISAAREFVGKTNQELLALAQEDLYSVFGNLVGTPAHSVVIREKRATFSATPQNIQKRPGSDTAIPNLFLAGDWTDTGLPATIEGAILSGQKAAARAALHCV